MSDKKQKAIADVIAKGDQIEQDEDEARIARNRELVKERALIRDVAGEKSFRAYLEKLVRETVTPMPPPPMYKPPKAAPHVTQETMLQVFSDWHGYEFVDLEGTRGHNEYNAEIMSRRVRHVVESHLSIKHKLERGGGWRFNDLIVCCNGDFVSGTIHEVEKYTDAPNIILAVYGVGRMLASALRDLAGAYRSVKVYCTSGNHGRLPDDRKMRQKDPLRNWDTMLYLIARENLRDVPNITFHIPNSYGLRFDVGGWGFGVSHGHDIKSSFSIPYYGINRMTGNLTALEAIKRHLIHYWIFSHFHTQSQLWAPAGESFINGSLIGGTELSVNAMGKSDRPQQLMMAVHPEHGITHRWPLYANPSIDAPGYVAKPFDLS